MKSSTGFTLIELMFSIALLAIIAGIGLTAYTNFNRRQLVNQATSNLRSDMRLAQNKATSGEKPIGWCTSNQLTGYQISFAAHSYSIVAVCSVGPTQAIKTVTLPNTITLTGGTMLFKVLNQGVDSPGDIRIQSSSLLKTITVSSQGNININP